MPRLPQNMHIDTAGVLHIAGCSTLDLVREYGTPLYVLDEELIRDRCRQYRDTLDELLPDSDVLYAGKAFMSTGMCRLVDSEDLALDVVSGGELHTALQAGFPASRIYFHGNNKSLQELEAGLQSGVGRVVVDNYYELEMLNRLCGHLGRKANVLLRIAPGVEAHTHSYIQTGQTDSKFGFGLENGLAFQAVKTAIAMNNILLQGLHCHIGSQIFDLEAYVVTVDLMMSFMKQVRDETGIQLRELDLGGGLGIYYSDGDAPVQPRQFVETLAGVLTDKARETGLRLPKIILEPGRSIVGEAGTTLYTIGAIKDIPGIRKYVSVDGGMSDNPRVALYQAKYSGIIANKADQEPQETVSIAGKCCESGDMLIWDLEVPAVEPGDILAVLSTGAYNYSMASNYNRLPRPAAVVAYKGEADLLIERESYDQLIQNDRIPARWRERQQDAERISRLA